MDVSVIGTGYVGLVTGSCLAELGHHVVCVDKNEDKVESLCSGNISIFEVGLEDLVQRHLESGHLEFSTDLDSAVSQSDVVFVTVDTPADENGAADLSRVDEVAKRFAAAISDYTVVVNKSTVPVGSTRRVQRIIEENSPHPLEFDVVSNPEFLREGTGVSDFLNPYRVVVGTDSQKATGVMAELYSGIDAPLLITDPVSAELIKYASNAFLATKVAYINAIANMCEAMGGNAREVALGMGYDPRIGFEFLRCGPGFGGSCLPKDCRAMVQMALEHGYDFELLKGVMEVNESQRELMVKKAERLVGDLKNARIGALGLAFKANTDDVRDSPATAIVKKLVERGAKVRAYDPEAMENAAVELPQVEMVDDPYVVVEDADAVVLLTEWDQFKRLDYEKVRSLMKRSIIIDTRNCLDPAVLRRLGFTYEGVGK